MLWSARRASAPREEASMKDLGGKVAVVTGAASGIGKALATRFAAYGMKVVLADVEEGPLAALESELRAQGASVLAMLTDVTNGTAVTALAARTVERFGAAHVVCNNAGVGGAGGPVWALTEADWTWTLGVNLWGVIHGMRAFVPILLAQGEGHVVNTASMAGLTSPPGMGPYVATKHAVVAISEVLARDLLVAGSQVKVSVLCPGFVRTRIAESGRNRPAHLAGARVPDADGGALAAEIRALVEGGMDPATLAEHTVDAIRQDRFYILTHPETVGAVKHRLDDVLQGNYPRLPPPIKRG
jgi:NAD(P)-dependent dehydrogenase (short-subunit alcohol dehydrogenase family)